MPPLSLERGGTQRPNNSEKPPKKSLRLGKQVREEVLIEEELQQEADRIVQERVPFSTERADFGSLNEEQKLELLENTIQEIQQLKSKIVESKKDVSIFEGVLSLYESEKKSLSNDPERLGDFYIKFLQTKERLADTKNFVTEEELEVFYTAVDDLTKKANQIKSNKERKRVDSFLFALKEKPKDKDQYNDRLKKLAEYSEVIQKIIDEQDQKIHSIQLFELSDDIEPEKRAEKFENNINTVESLYKKGIRLNVDYDEIRTFLERANKLINTINSIAEKVKIEGKTKDTTANYLKYEKFFNLFLQKFAEKIADKENEAEASKAFKKVQEQQYLDISQELGFEFDTSKLKERLLRVYKVQSESELPVMTSRIDKINNPLLVAYEAVKNNPENKSAIEHLNLLLLKGEVERVSYRSDRSKQEENIPTRGQLEKFAQKLFDYADISGSDLDFTSFNIEELKEFAPKSPRKEPKEEFSAQERIIYLEKLMALKQKLESAQYADASQEFEVKAKTKEIFDGDVRTVLTEDDIIEPIKLEKGLKKETRDERIGSIIGSHQEKIDKLEKKFAPLNKKDLLEKIIAPYESILVEMMTLKNELKRADEKQKDVTYTVIENLAAQAEEAQSKAEWQINRLLEYAFVYQAKDDLSLFFKPGQYDKLLAEYEVIVQLLPTPKNREKMNQDLLQIHSDLLSAIKSEIDSFDNADTHEMVGNINLLLEKVKPGHANFSADLLSLLPQLEEIKNTYKQGVEAPIDEQRAVETKREEVRKAIVRTPEEQAVVKEEKLEKQKAQIRAERQEKEAAELEVAAREEVKRIHEKREASLNKTIELVEQNIEQLEQAEKPLNEAYALLYGYGPAHRLGKLNEFFTNKDSMPNLMDSWEQYRTALPKLLRQVDAFAELYSDPLFAQHKEKLQLIWENFRATAEKMVENYRTVLFVPEKMQLLAKKYTERDAVKVLNEKLKLEQENIDRILNFVSEQEGQDKFLLLDSVLYGGWQPKKPAPKGKEFYNLLRTPDASEVKLENVLEKINNLDQGIEEKSRKYKNLKQVQEKLKEVGAQIDESTTEFVFNKPQPLFKKANFAALFGYLENTEIKNTLKQQADLNYESDINQLVYAKLFEHYYKKYKEKFKGLSQEKPHQFTLIKRYLNRLKKDKFEQKKEMKSPLEIAMRQELDRAAQEALKSLNV